MSQALTISGELPGGVEVDGKTHRAFVLRLPTVRDNVEAIDAVGATNAMALSTAILARQIVSLGDLKPEQIDYDLLADMHPEDFNVLDAKAQELEKKRKAARGKPAPTSSASDSASSAPA
jgi:hypothetical protein